MPDLDELADALYTAPPAGFVAARDEAAATARAAGDRAGTAALSKLRRPTVGAWLVNLLAISRPDLIADFIALAAPLRAAQDSLRGDDLRALSTQRRVAVAALVDEARALARAADPTAAKLPLAEVEATLSAALAGGAAAEAVASGRLVRSISYAGFGEPPPPDLAGPAPSRRTTPYRSAAGGRPVAPAAAGGKPGAIQTGTTRGTPGAVRAGTARGKPDAVETGTTRGTPGAVRAGTARGESDGGRAGTARRKTDPALAAAREAETEARAAVDVANAAEREAAAALADAADVAVIADQEARTQDEAVTDAERRLAALEHELAALRADRAAHETARRAAAKARTAAEKTLEARRHETHEAQERLFAARRRVVDASS